VLASAWLATTVGSTNELTASAGNFSTSASIAGKLPNSSRVRTKSVVY